MPDIRLVVYLTWGVDATADAALSAQTLTLTDTHRAIITDCPGEAERSEIFDLIIPCEFSLPSYLKKAELINHLPTEYTDILFLDADTRVVGDIDSGFVKSRQYGLAICPAPHYNLTDFWGFEKYLSIFGINERDLLQFNTGVIFFQRTPEILNIFRKWRELCEIGAGDYEADQPFFTVAMELCGFNPYVLPPTFNYRSLGEQAVGKVRIWHSKYPVPSDLNSYKKPWPPRRFIDGRRQKDRVSVRVRAEMLRIYSAIRRRYGRRKNSTLATVARQEQGQARRS